MIPSLLLASLVACRPDDPPPTHSGTDTDTDAAPPGSLVWLTTGGGAAGQDCLSVAEAGDGTLVAVCNSVGFATWSDEAGTELETVSVGDQDVVFLGLDPADGSIRWHVPLGSDGFDDGWVGRATALPDGRVAAFAWMGGPLVNPPAGAPAVEAGDVLLLILTADGTVDEVHRLAANGFDYPDVVRLTPRPDSGWLVSISLLGDATLAPGTPQEVALPALGAPDDLSAVVAEYDADGTLRDHDRYQFGGDVDDPPGPGGRGLLLTALPDDDGGRTVAGWFTTRLVLGDADPLTLLDPEGKGQAFVASLGPDGEPRWGFAFGSEGEDWANYLARLPDGGVAVGGYFGAFVEGPPTLAVPGADGSPLAGVPVAEGCDLSACTGDVFVLTVGPDGAPRWLTGWASPLSDAIRGLDVFPDGGVVASAHVNGTFPSPDGKEPVTFPDGEVVRTPEVATVTVRYTADGDRAWTTWTDNSWGRSVLVTRDGGVVQANELLLGAVLDAGGPTEVEAPFTGMWDGAVYRLAP